MSSEDSNFNPQLEKKIVTVIEFLKKKLDCNKVTVSEPDAEGDWVSFDARTIEGFAVRISLVMDGESF